MLSKKIILLILLSFINLNSKIIIISIPKCGTHLLSKSIELLTSKQLQAPEIHASYIAKEGLPEFDDRKKFIRCHLPYSANYEKQLNKEKYKTFFIFRDPRDQIVSEAYWTQRRIIERNEPFLTIEQLIDRSIEKITQYYNQFLPWIKSSNVCSVKFENLIGAIGGGNNILQRREITKISQFLNIYSLQLTLHTINNLFGGTLTFREGKIGSWRKQFNAKQIRRLKHKAGKLLIALGYEKDLNW